MKGMKAMKSMKPRHLKKKLGPADKFRLRLIHLYMGIFLLIMSGGVASGFILYRGDYALFRINDILVYGNKHLAETELKALSGISAGENILRLSAKRTAVKLLESPWIKAVSVRKDFQGTVLVNIHEASPFAILDIKGKAFLIDDRGKRLEEMKNNPVPFLPIIYSEERDNNNFAEALALAKVIKDRNIATERGRVEIIANVKGPEDISVVVDGLLIKIGQGNYEQKLSRLFSLEEEVKKMPAVDYIDLRFANRVVVKPINGVVK